VPQPAAVAARGDPAEVADLEGRPLVAVAVEQREPHTRRRHEQRAAGGAQRGGDREVDLQDAGRVAGGDEDPLPAGGGVRQPLAHPLQRLHGQLGVDGVGPGGARQVGVDADPLGHQRHHLLVGPRAQRPQPELVGGIALGEPARVAEVGLARGVHVTGDQIFP
jgi:hypothetical protein